MYISARTLTFRRILDVARHVHAQSYKLVVITNQAGIARGDYTEEQFHQLTDWMCQRFSTTGAPIERVYFSPYHPTAGLGHYFKDDFSRNPHHGMIHQAQKELSIDLSRSVLIGYKVTDIQAGNAPGVSKNLLFAANRPSDLDDLSYKLIATLPDAISFLQRGVNETVVLAGGFGTRLKTVITDVPKALAPIGDIPFLLLQLEHWLAQGLREFTFLLHHQADQIIAFFKLIRARCLRIVKSVG
jgi:D-glycero-D-manno-heptose 1,7-bisphosphate phosphatase